MKISRINLAYFSATYTTRKILRAFGGQFEPLEIVEYDLSKATGEIDMSETELLVVGIPVYAGRVPAIVLPGLSNMKGRNTPAVIVAVYGNRDYDDALLELHDIVASNGFRVLSAGAFVAQHSIFPQVGHDRPDEKDLAAVWQFAMETRKRLDTLPDTGLIGEVAIEGNHPYKVPGKIPLHPRANRRCDKCGTCVKLCPTQAIPEAKPRMTSGMKCISCGRCIQVCPQNARHFGGLLYRVAGKKFVKAYGALRKDPWVGYAAIEGVI